MARPKAFDRDKALKAALTVFWRQGYEATSLDDLLVAMGIGRQSLYDTFVDKRHLYLEALQTYNSRNLEALIESSNRMETPLGLLRDILMNVALDSSEARAQGCMGINAICEFGQASADVDEITQSSSTLLLSTLKHILNQAKAKKEIAADVDVDKAAHFLNSMLSGLKVRARAGDSPEVLRDAASFALAGISSRP